MLPSRNVLCLLLFWVCASPLLAEDTDSRFSIHGYLSQAYAESDQRQILGITPEGEVDYRTAALLIRYDINDDNHLVLQVSHERFGASPFNTDKDLELDWAYYEHHFSWGSRLQAGKVPLPFGIYNKIRDVGTILPFYRPPNTVYGENDFLSETLDGVVVGHTLGQANGWSLDTELYYGGWRTTSSTQTAARIDDAVGAQLWLDTPLVGLRFGLGLRHNDVVGTTTGSNTFDTSLVSFELDRQRFLLQGEYEEVDFRIGDGFEAYFGLVGIHATSKLSLYFQTESSTIRIFRPFGTLELDLNDETAVGIAYAFQPEIVLKLETHWNEGISQEDLTREERLSGRTFETRFTILSISASF